MEKVLYQTDEFNLKPSGWYKTIPPKKEGDEVMEIMISGPIAITNRFIDPLSRKEKVILSDLKNIELVEKASVLTSLQLPSLIEYGFTINEKHVRDLGFALQKLRNNTPLSALYSGVGILHTTYGAIISLDQPYFSKDISDDAPIICDNKYDLTPKGSLDIWLTMYTNEVRGNLPLELSVVFGVSSLVAAYLKYHNEVEFSGTIFSFTGQSSTGKSTAAMLAASVAGNPTKGTETLFRSWNATRNALEGYLSENYGVPIVLDELSAATFYDTTGLLYSFAEGQGRQRANIHGDIKTPRNWGTSIISTSEHSIFKQSAKNDGLRVRTIEISEEFTSSAQNSDTIKRTVSQNYGHILPIIAQFLLDNTDDIISVFREEESNFYQLLSSESNNTGIRMIKRYAVLTTTAHILNQSQDLQLDINKIKNYLSNYHKETVSERSLADKAMEVIVQFIAENLGKFSQQSRLANMIQNFGILSLKDNYIEVKIIRNIFEKMLTDHQFEDTKNVIDSLDDAGRLISDRDRKTTKRSVKDDTGKSTSLVFYQIKIDIEYADILGLQKPNNHIDINLNTNPPKANNELLNDFIKKAQNNSDDIFEDF